MTLARDSTWMWMFSKMNEVWAFRCSEWRRALLVCRFERLVSAAIAHLVSSYGSPRQTGPTKFPRIKRAMWAARFMKWGATSS
jgi:hypothetical protein